MITRSISVRRDALHRVRLYHCPALSSVRVDRGAPPGAPASRSFLSSHTATSPHGAADSIDVLQSNRVSSSKKTDSPFHVPGNAESTLRGSGRHQRIQVSNFMKMLRYQETASREPQNENFSSKERVSDDTPRRGLLSNQDSDAASQSTMTYLKANPELRRNQSQAVASERPSWRNRQKVKRSETHIAPKKRSSVATSEWIQVSSTPPMSKLSDLFPSLNQIIEIEVEKGIIDLDALETLNHNSGAESVIHSLDELDASKSLYTTEPINGGTTNIPLWTPTSSNNIRHSYLDACPMIQEARLQLSVRAHPVGWFLRLPCRSVVNAVLNHVRLANNQLLNSVQINSLKQERKKWREGLWKGVYAEYESRAEVKDMQLSLDKDHHDEKELMWGHGNLGQDVEEGSRLESVSVGESDPATAYDQVNEGNSYLQSYIQKHPFPSQLMKLPSYRPLKSGSTIVSVREFLPFISDSSFTDKKHIPWDQCAFHMSPLLNISDSVIRLETTDLNLNEEDIQYIFRGYDLKSIPELIESTTLPFGFDAFIKFFGWNIARSNNVDMIAKGKYDPHENISMRGQTKGVTRREKTHIFLVRFASPGEARMAIRANSGHLREYSDRLHVAAFPSSGIGQI